MADHLLHALSGGLAGMAVDSILFPLDTLKTRLQSRAGLLRDPPPGAAAAAGRAASAARPFYRGLLSAMLGSFPAAATFWTVYEASKLRLLHALSSRGLEGFDSVAHVGAAALADVAVCAVRNPFEVVKQQMQLGLHANTRAAVSKIVATDGVLRGLYAGYLSTLLREIPFDAIQFALYELLKARYAAAKAGSAAAASRVDVGGAAPLPPPLVLWENAMLGCFAGGVAAAATTPLDVIKTRLMTQTRTAAAERYAGWRDAARRIVREEGVAALFSGIRPRVAWISIGGGIFIGTYEEGKRQLAAVLL